jgi:hypothetical protein
MAPGEIRNGARHGMGTWREERMLAIRSVHLFDGERSRPGRPTVIVEGAMIELSERDMHTIVDGVVGDDFVVAAAQVLHERAPGCDYAQRVGRLHPARRPQPGFESAVIGFHSVIGRAARRYGARRTPARRSRR